MKVAIASGKGGTGKTTLAVNFASYMAEKQKIILVDIDVEEPNSGLFIKAKLTHQEDKYKMHPEWIESRCTLCGLCQKICNFHAIIQLGPQIMVFPELCHSCYACSELCPTEALPMKKQKMGKLKHYQNKNLTFIESRLMIGQEQAVPLISQTHEYVDKNFSDAGLIIFDSPPGTSCPIIEATKDADFIILITEPTPFGFHDLKLAIETMKELKKDFGVVINRDGIGNDEVLTHCLASNIPVLAKIPNDRKIAELYSKGELIYNKHPKLKSELANIKKFIQNYKPKAS